MDKLRMSETGARPGNGPERAPLAALAAEYRRGADALEKRVAELRQQMSEERGAESVLLEQRIQTLRYEMGDLRKIAVWLERYGRTE